VTRVYFHAGRIRLRVILALLLCVIGGGSALVFGFRWLLGMPDEDVRRQTIMIAVMVSAICVALTIFSWVLLRPVAAMLRRIRDVGEVGAPTEEAARKATLRFSSRLTIAGVSVAGLGLVAAVLFDLVVWRLDGGLVAGMAIGSLSVTFVAAAFLYVIVRALLRPITAHFRHEEVPDGFRVSIQSKVTLVILTLALAAALPTAVIARSRALAIRDRARELDHLHLAEALAYGGTALDPDALRQTVASLHLSNDARVRFAEEGGRTASPLPARYSASYIEIDAERAPDPYPAPLVVMVVLLLAVATYVGRTLGANLSFDVRIVTGRIASLAQPWSEGRTVRPLVAGAPQFSDVRRLADAVNTLLNRIAEINVAHFVAIEKTVAADRVKMQFLANVSHDLRSPLNSILGFSELLLRDTEQPLQGRARQAVALIHRAGGELLRLIDEVLDTAKLEAGRIALHREDSLPTEIVTQAIREIQRSGVPDGVALDTELQAGLPMVWVDSHRLGVALEHLIRFCIESIDRHGKVVVRVRAETLDHEVAPAVRRVLQLRIADTSRGLEGEEVGKLFIGFQRKPGRRGLGLGLPLAKAFIELHGGTLSVFSTPGVGTTFSADIPLMQKKALGRLRPVKV
jgi:signal transduction histidine kinase